MPTDDVWGAIRDRSIGRTVVATWYGWEARAPDRMLSKGQVALEVSTDPVGAPIFYRDVPLMPSPTEEGQIKPLAHHALPLIAWRLRDVSRPDSRVVLSNMPTCGNCHSFSLDGKTVASASKDGTLILWNVTPVAPMTGNGASRLVGARLEGFETAPPPLRTYDPRTRLVPRNGFALAAPAAPPKGPNPYLQMRWSEHHPNHWVPRAQEGDVEAMYRLAIIREIEGSDEEAHELHKKVAASTEAAQAEWAAKSRRRLETVPWLRK